MAGTSFNAADIDFDALETRIAKLKPRKLEIEEVLGRLRARLVEQMKRGVTVAQLREALSEGGIDVAERSLKQYLEKGEWPGRKNEKARIRAATAPPLDLGASGPSTETAPDAG